MGYIVDRSSVVWYGAWDLLLIDVALCGMVYGIYTKIAIAESGKIFEIYDVTHRTTSQLGVTKALY